jgi:hypothetical protein
VTAPDFALSDFKGTHGLTSSRRQVRRPERLISSRRLSRGESEFGLYGAVTSRTARVRDLRALQSRHVELSSPQESSCFQRVPMSSTTASEGDLIRRTIGYLSPSIWRSPKLWLQSRELKSSVYRAGTTKPQEIGSPTLTEIGSPTIQQCARSVQAWRETVRDELHTCSFC